MATVAWRSAVIAVALFVSYAYFYQAGGWNANSRFDLVRAIVEQGTVVIDAYHTNTGDKSLYNGHHYTDKAPGQSLTAVPVVALGRMLAEAANRDATTPSSIAVLSYGATVWAAAGPTIVAALSLAWVSRQLGATPGGATFAALAFGLATPAWVYATMLWGHALAAGCLMLAFAAAVGLREAGGKRRDTCLALLVGLAAGWAVVTEYPAAPAAAVLALLACLGAWRSSDRSRVWRVAISVGLGAGATAFVLFAYNVAAFGSPLRLGYQYVEGFAGMDEGFLGITSPRPSFLQEILFGESRGLLPLAPVLAAAPIGFVLVWRRPEARLPTIAAATVVGYYALFNASYFYWNGGNSYGPRHLGAALPFMCLGLAPLWSIPRWWLRGGLLALAAYGFCLSAMAVSTLVLLPGDVGAPVRERILPAFASGDLALNPQTFLETGQSTRPANPLLSAWNVGQRLGLHGHESLIPLAVAWGVAAVLLWRASVDPARQLSPGRRSQHVEQTAEPLPR
jgi:hypothetical protein